MYYDSIGRMVE